MRGASWPTDRASPPFVGAPRCMWTRSSGAPTLASCLSSRRHSSSSSSTSRRPRPWGSRFPGLCSCVPTRRSSEAPRVTSSHLIPADVVVIGAGIMGVSTAYHLARRRAGRIVVLERDDVCSGSTALASGGIRHQYANRVGIELTLAGIETFERFEVEFGVDPSFRQHGYLILIATEEERASARRSVALQRSLGVAVELLDAAATRALCPYLNTGDLLGATYTPRDGYADPYSCATAIAARARDLGVTIKQQHEVRGFIRAGDRVLGVTTAAG